MRLNDKIAIVVGAGQSPGEGMGNGRATVLRFVQEGATVMAVDRDLASVEETVAMARQHGPCVAFEADVTKEKMLAAMIGAAREKFGRIDVLHYNVGLSVAGGTRYQPRSVKRHSIASSPSTCAAASWR
jgi:NAD(P)-dependent dehydrogenase (short-subunit alcohol dehydrogenase family)